MSILTDEQNADLIDRWYVFEPTNEEAENVMCHFATIFSDWAADRNSTVLKALWLARMRPEYGYKVLFNEDTLGRKEKFVETLKNLKRKGFDPPANLPGNTRVPIKVSHMIYAGDTRLADRTAASQHTKDIFKSVRSPAHRGDTDFPNNNQDEVQAAGSQDCGASPTTCAQHQLTEPETSNALQKITEQIRTMQTQMQGLMSGGYGYATQPAPQMASRPTTYTAATYSPWALPKTHQYAMPYNNSAVFNNHVSPMQGYGLQPNTAVVRTVQKQPINRPAGRIEDRSERD